MFLAQLFSQIFREVVALKLEIAVISKTMAFGVSNLLLDLRPKCLTCEQLGEGNTLVFTKQDYYNPV